MGKIPRGEYLGQVGISVHFPCQLCLCVTDRHVEKEKWHLYTMEPPEKDTPETCVDVESSRDVFSETNQTHRLKYQWSLC